MSCGDAAAITGGSAAPVHARHAAPAVPAAHVGSHLQCLQVRTLLGHHSGQQLVLQAFPCHQEVDQRALCLHLRLVVRVEVLGVQDQAELRVVLHFFVSYLNVSVWVIMLISVRLAVTHARENLMGTGR